MKIDSKLFFEVRKDYPELSAIDVANFIKDKNFDSEVESFIGSIETEEIKKDGKVDYIAYKKDGLAINNVRGGIVEKVKLETAENEIYKKYKDELMDYVFDTLKIK